MSVKCQSRHNGVPTHRSKKDRYSITSSARASSVTPTPEMRGILRASAQMRSGMLWHVLQPYLLSSRCSGLFGSLVQPCELVVVEQGFPVELREDV
jgi:hypothetical protein